MESLISIANSFFAKLYIPCRVPADKQAHALSGFIIAIFLTFFVGAYSVMVVAIIALLKEIYDYINKDIHTPDFWDWLVTALGGVIGFIVVTLF
jgi:hypothetical protein